MGETTQIQWCDHTFNPWIGCVKVSPECKHCYAEQSTPARRSKARGLPLWGPGSARQYTSDAYWKQPFKWARRAKRDGVRRRVFCASLADVFERRTELDVKRAMLWALIELTPELDYLLVTKRPENVLGMVPERWLRNGFPPNVWIGTTAGTQETADERIPHLVRIPAAVRFVSVEPLLERVVLDADWLYPRCKACGRHSARGKCCEYEPDCTGGTEHSAQAQPGLIDWVIVGGESGPNARECRIEWIESIVTRCAQARVACFVKQLGAYAVLDPRYDRTVVISATVGARAKGAQRRLAHAKGGDPLEWPADLRVRQFPAAAVQP